MHPGGVSTGRTAPTGVVAGTVAALITISGCAGSDPNGHRATRRPSTAAATGSATGSAWPAATGGTAGTTGSGSAGSGGAAATAGAGSRAGPGATLTGWTVTVYYTAVERFHTDAPVTVTGCRRLDCAHGRDDLGRYPSSFVSAVHDEGTGRTSGGTYLNWSYDTGYWLDTAPRDSAGGPLRPWESAAADRSVLPAGTRFRITGCGHDEDGSRVPGGVCDRFRSARWTVTDEFTPGLGGSRHVDVYVGEETGPGFTDSDLYATLSGATLETG